MTNCKGCGKEIVWVELLTGKMMPCDPEVITVKEGQHFTLVREGIVNTKAKPGTLGRISHWATCENAKNFRGGRREKK